LLDYDFEASIGYWVVMTSQALERALNEELAPHGVTYRQWQVLCWLALKGDLTQAELAAHMRIEPATLVGVLDRMERDGWITRQVSGSDRRKKIIRPTLRVEPVWKKITACARRVRARATRGLSPRDLQRTRDVLATMQNNLRVLEQIEEAV
jgi:MarR family transcriptional regulator for hemolysin